jgi:hypothetical protein
MNVGLMNFWSMNTSKLSVRKRSAAVAMLGLVVWGSAQAAPAGTPVEAIWYTQSLDFRFRGTGVAYSCAGLTAKLAAILSAVGARNSSAMRCRGNGVSSVEVELQAQSAVAATAENLAAVTQFDAKQRLLAHLKGERLPSVADIPRFSARWQVIDVHRIRRVRLGPGDCELLQQVSEQLFPKLAIEVVHDGLSCHPGSATRISRPLRVVALFPNGDGESVPQVGAL